MSQIRTSSNYGFSEHSVQKHKIFDPIRMVQHSFLVLALVEMKFVILDAGSEVGPDALTIGVFIKPTQMGGNARVKTTNDVVEYLLLVAHLTEHVGPFETILLVYQFPDLRAVVIGKRLDILVNIKILTPIVGFVLNVPGPSIDSGSSFILP